MIDTSLLTFAYVFLGLAALTAVLSIAGIALVVRDGRRATVAVVDVVRPEGERRLSPAA